MIAAILKFPLNICAMCGEPATQSIDLIDEYDRPLGQKHLCNEYPFCKEESPHSPGEKRPVTDASTDEEALALVMNVLQRIADTALAGFKGDGYDESSALSDINNLSRGTIDALARRTLSGISPAATAGWQPIQTAPKKDGKHLRMFGDGESWHACEFIGHWYGGGWRECYSKHAAWPTYWMPCDPPKDDGTPPHSRPMLSPTENTGE